MKKNIFYLLILNFYLLSCSKYELDFNKFNEYAPTVEFALPLAYSNLKITSLVNNNKENSRVDGSNLIHVLIRDDSTFEYTNNKITEIKSQTLTSVDTILGFVEVGNENLNKSISLQSLLPDLNATNRNVLNMLNGTTNVFPAISDSTKTIQKFTTLNNFSLIYVKSGSLSFDLTNFLPTTIDSIVFDIYNTSSNKLVFSSVTLSNILSNQKKSVILNIKEGTVLDNVFSYKIRRLKTRASSGIVPINLNDNFSINLMLLNLKLGAGLAKLPSQTIQSFTRSANVSANALGERFFNIAFDTAETFMQGLSSINYPLEIKIKFLNATKNNTEFPEQTLSIPPQQAFNYKAIDFSKVQFLFDRNSLLSNTVDFEIKINIIGSDINYVAFDSSQRLNFNLRLASAKLLYVVGIIKDTTSTYLTRDINNTELKNISSGFAFDSATLTVNSKNSIGVPFIIDLSLNGINADQTAFLRDRFTPFQINTPIVPNDVTPFNYSNLTFATTQHVFSNYGENRGKINEFVSLPAITGTINAKVNINTERDFISFGAIGQKLYIGTLLDIPLILNARNVVLTDTIKFESNSFEGLDSLVLGLNIENGFPFRSDVKIYFINASNTIVDSSVISGVLTPSAINSDGKTIAPSTSQSSFSLSKTQINNLINQKANNIVVKATFFTPNDGTSQVKIYNDYFMNIKFGVITKITLSN